MTLDAEEALPPSLPGHVTADSGSTEATGEEEMTS